MGFIVFYQVSENCVAGAGWTPIITYSYLINAVSLIQIHKRVMSVK